MEYTDKGIPWCKTVGNVTVQDSADRMEDYKTICV
jgi:hypothetical protein